MPGKFFFGTDYITPAIPAYQIVTSQPRPALALVLVRPDLAVYAYRCLGSTSLLPSKFVCLSGVFKAARKLRTFDLPSTTPLVEKTVHHLTHHVHLQHVFCGQLDPHTPQQFGWLGSSKQCVSL